MCRLYVCVLCFFSGVRSSPRTNKKKSPSSQQKEEKNKKEQRSAADFFGAKKVAIGSKAAPSVSVLWMITVYRLFVSTCFRYAFMQPSWVKNISILISYCNTVDACDDEAMINPAYTTWLNYEHISCSPPFEIIARLVLTKAPYIGAGTCLFRLTSHWVRVICQGPTAQCNNNAHGMSSLFRL
mgnify:CR=1 FL=1